MRLRSWVFRLFERSHHAPQAVGELLHCEFRVICATLWRAHA